MLAAPLEEERHGLREGFGDWLARLPTTAALPWLGDLARFEWGLERVSLLAPETRRWPAERLAAMTPEHWERLVLHPACDLQLLESPIRCWRSGRWPCTAVRDGQELDAVCSLALKKRPGHRVDPIPWMPPPGVCCKAAAGQAAGQPAGSGSRHGRTPGPLITLDLLVDLELPHDSANPCQAPWPLVERILPWCSGGLLLLARLWVATIFLRSGWLKFTAWDSTLYLFEFEYQVPLLPWQWAAYRGHGDRAVAAPSSCWRASSPVRSPCCCLASTPWRSSPTRPLWAGGFHDHQLWGWMLLTLAVWGRAPGGSTAGACPSPRLPA